MNKEKVLQIIELVKKTPEIDAELLLQIVGFEEEEAETEKEVIKSISMSYSKADDAKLIDLLFEHKEVAKIPKGKVKHLARRLERTEGAIRSRLYIFKKKIDEAAEWNPSATEKGKEENNDIFNFQGELVATEKDFDGLWRVFDGDQFVHGFETKTEARGFAKENNGLAIALMTIKDGQPTYIQREAI